MDKQKKKIIRESLFILVFFLAGAFFAQAEEIKQGIRTIQAVSGWNKIKISWEKNEYLSETQSIVLVRQKDRCPQNLSDGDEIYRGNGAWFEDEFVLQGEKYCYGVGLVELSGGTPSFKVSQLTQSVSWQRRIGLMFESKLNLMMLFEALVLAFFIFLGNWRKKRIKKAKEKLILRKP
jgi:hypothetical protein